MKTKTWLLIWGIMVASALCFIGAFVYKIDPFFHYHKPLTDKYYYDLPSTGRNLDDGIIKNFDYDGIVIGTSLIENVKPSEVDRIFGGNFIKTPLAGASFHEIDGNIGKACRTHKDLKVVIRCLDMDRFYDTWDFMRTDLGEYPTYLYDNNPFNDVQYLLNRDVLFNRVYPMIQEAKAEGFTPGIRSFDDYSNWQSYSHFGINTACPGGLSDTDTEQVHLSHEEKEIIRKNVELNVTSLTDKYPNVDFYYYFPPYSFIRWNEWKKQGTLIKMLETKAFITELIIGHDNIKLYSFSDIPEITTDLNNYKDNVHYAEWVNSFIMQCLHDGRYRLTPDNYRDYDKEEYDFYSNFDYTSVNGQEDYEDDYYAAAILNGLKNDAPSIDVLNDSSLDVTVNGAEVISGDGSNAELDCIGTLNRDPSNTELQTYLRDSEFIGIRFTVDLDKGYDYLCFKGRKITDHGGIAAYVYDSEGNAVAALERRYEDLDNETHQYVMNLSGLQGKVTVILNGGYTDWSGSPDSELSFSDIFVY